MKSRNKEDNFEKKAVDMICSLVEEYDLPGPRLTMCETAKKILQLCHSPDENKNAIRLRVIRLSKAANSPDQYGIYAQKAAEVVQALNLLVSLNSQGKLDQEVFNAYAAPKLQDLALERDYCKKLYENSQKNGAVRSKNKVNSLTEKQKVFERV